MEPSDEMKIRMWAIETAIDLADAKNSLFDRCDPADILVIARMFKDYVTTQETI